jgi:hypothetical protein
MKDRIQAELRVRYQGLTKEEVRQDQESRIRADPILGPFYSILVDKSGTGDDPNPRQSS